MFDGDFYGRQMNAAIQKLPQTKIERDSNRHVISQQLEYIGSCGEREGGAETTVPHQALIESEFESPFIFHLIAAKSNSELLFDFNCVLISLSN